MSKSARFFLIFSMVLGIIASYFFYVSVNTQLISPLAANDTKNLYPLNFNRKSTITPEPPQQFIQEKAIGLEKFESDLKSIVDKNNTIDISVVFKDLQNDQSIEINSRKIYHAASTTKLITAVKLLSEIENGRFNLSDKLGNYTILYQLEQLINQSNNVSWDLFNNLLGLKNQQDFVQEFGITNYNSNRNEIAPQDTALLLELLLKGKIIGSSSVRMLLSYMQNTDVESFIPAAVPGKFTVYHKYGLYEDNVHDAAVINKGQDTYIWVIYTNGRGYQYYDTRVKIIHQLTEIFVNYLES